MNNCTTNKDVDEIKANWSIDRTFSSMMDKDVRDEKIAGWKKAIDTALYWAKEN